MSKINVFYLRPRPELNRRIAVLQTAVLTTSPRGQLTYRIDFFSQAPVSRLPFRLSAARFSFYEVKTVRLRLLVRPANERSGRLFKLPLLMLVGRSRSSSVRLCRTPDEMAAGLCPNNQVPLHHTQNRQIKQADSQCILLATPRPLLPTYLAMSEDTKRISWSQVAVMIGDAFSGTKWRYIVITFLLVVATCAGVAEPIIYGRVIDIVINAVSTNTASTLFSALLAYLIAWAMIDIVGSAAREMAAFAGYKVADTVWLRFWRSTLRGVLFWDPDRFTNTSLGGLAKKLDTAGSSLWRLAGTTLNSVLPPILSVIAFFAVGLRLNAAMTCISFIGILPLFIMTAVAQQAVEKRQDKMNENWESFLQKLVEIISNIVPIKSFAAENRLLEYHVGLGELSMKSQSYVNRLWSWLGFGTSISRFLTRFIVLVAGLYFVSRGTLTVGNLITFLGLVTTLLAPFDQILVELMRRIADIRSSFARLHDQFTQKNKLLEPGKPIKIKNIRGQIELRNVSYNYPATAKETLKNISLTIPAGTSLALVGPSGSGKSTLVKFIHRFLDPNKGEVLIDNVNVKDIALSTVRSSVGVVHQETVLFNDTVLENIRFAKPHSSTAEIIAACKKAQAHEFISRMPNKYKTIIGERGVKLSGGERQRLALARIFLANPPILILDESTSALDSETELRLQIALKAAMRGRTTVIIAHRLSTIYLADNIAVIEKGRIVEQGTHQELLEEKGLYNHLWNIQSGGYV